jgi:hypothetical protein
MKINKDKLNFSGISFIISSFLISFAHSRDAQLTAIPVFAIGLGFFLLSWCFENDK